MTTVASPDPLANLFDDDERRRPWWQRRRIIVATAILVVGVLIVAVRDGRVRGDRRVVSHRGRHASAPWMPS